MGVEIERKFLLRGHLPAELLALTPKEKIVQGYLCDSPDKTIRVRTVNHEGRRSAYLTIKGKAQGISRVEIETQLLDFNSANEMLNTFCQKKIEKTRYKFPALYPDGAPVLDNTFMPLTWEIDEFHGENDGLWIAEIELQHEKQQIVLPAWIGEEVSTDFRFTNVALCNNPYKNWK